jgi:8-oxo-dGTP pyrophosphatase MutT (NUDIX family)
MEEIYRVAVRGIIFIDGKLLMIENSFGEAKLPGGGIEGDEDDYTALLREVKEETGFDVIPESIVPFGEIEEKRLSVKEPMIWHQFSRLYFCEVYPGQGTCEYTENEKKYGFHQVLYTLEEALEKNYAMLEREGKQAWNQREYETLQLIKNHIRG